MENLDRGENRGVVFRSTKIDERSRRDDYPLAGGLDDTRAQRGVQRTCVARLLVKEASALRNNPLMEPRCLRSDNPRATLSQRVISILFTCSLSSPLVIPRRREFRLGRRNSDCSRGKGRIEESLVGLDHLFLFFSFFCFFFFGTNGTRVWNICADPRWRTSALDGWCREEKVGSNRIENIRTFKKLKFTRHSRQKNFRSNDATMRNFFSLFFYKNRVVGFWNVKYHE